MSNRCDISPEYADAQIVSKPGERLHRLFAMLCDTWIDDLSLERIHQLEEFIISWRWMNARGERMDT
ncbi:hypothetical protein GJ654_18610 [Rhodoblastus acidophilus]|uniref:Uncharacterized protein n=1 Tax=Rhodoblastus acidophilus TaxID=1074 RepID=A0A6N8DT49_RHOAC|nr:hypothetical protein [Rhodoblastus acidophilus]MCW2276339.1 hypothetical protein [Rhodoblastus acidophilus]MTV32996.1 hypothetical protein [Rhodoblastus acidophilus]